VSVVVVRVQVGWHACAGVDRCGSKGVKAAGGQVEQQETLCDAKRMTGVSYGGQAVRWPETRGCEEAAGSHGGGGEEEEENGGDGRPG